MLEHQSTSTYRNLPNWLDRGGKPNADALISFSFDGKPMTGRKGESVAAALIGAGVHSFRKSREGQHRGLYCGMGTCFECLLTIDGDLSQRACLVSVKEGMDIQSQAYAPAIGSKKNSLKCLKSSIQMWFLNAITHVKIVHIHSSEHFWKTKRKLLQTDLLLRNIGLRVSSAVSYVTTGLFTVLV